MALTKVHTRMIEGSVASVIDYGADATGVADSTSAIQAAMDASEAVYFPTGTYLISSSLEYGSNAFLFGDGDASVIKLVNNTNANMFFPNITFGTEGSPSSASVDNVCFKDLCLDQNFTDGVFSESIMTIAAISAKNMLIDNVHFKNPEGDCVYISKSYGGQASTVVPYDIQITNSRFTGNNVNRNGISVITGYQIRISGNHFYKITKEDMPGPIDLEPNVTTEYIQNVVIANNTFNQCHGSVTTYITGTSATDYETIRNISIINNVFDEQTADDPYVAETQSYIAIYNAKNVTVMGNCLYGARDLGIALSSCYGVICSNNTIINTNLGGIRILDIFESKIDNNYIEIKNDQYNSTSCYGIDIDTSAVVVGDNHSMEGGSLSGNTIVSIASTPSNNSGIIMQGNVTDVAVSGIIRGFAVGIYVGQRVSKIATDLKIDLDVTQNTTPIQKSGWGTGGNYPSTLGKYNLGRDVTFGQSSFSASTSKLITGLPVLTTSLFRVSRIGTTGLANNLTAECLDDGEITVRSSASESGSFIWEILDL